MKMDVFKKELDEIMETKCLSFEVDVCDACEKRAKKLRELLKRCRSNRK